MINVPVVVPTSFSRRLDLVILAALASIAVRELAQRGSRHIRLAAVSNSSRERKS